MATLLDSYKQQYSTLTADIVSKTGKIPNLHGDEKRNKVTYIQRLIDEGKELLEQMDLEVRGLPQGERQSYQNLVKNYTTELNKLERDLKKAQISLSDDMHAREELLGGDDSHISEDQRARLLDNTERLERGTRRLDSGYKTCIETEQIGTDILEDLNHQRETIQKSRNRLRETNEGLGKSSRILSGMMRRIIQNRILLVALSLVFVVIIGIAIYFATRKKS